MFPINCFCSFVETKQADCAWKAAFLFVRKNNARSVSEVSLTFPSNDEIRMQHNAERGENE